MPIDATALSAVTALRTNLLSEVKNAAQASAQASQRQATDQIGKTEASVSDTNTAAASPSPYRGTQVDTSA
jgi:hypothetical protein